MADPAARAEKGPWALLTLDLVAGGALAATLIYVAARRRLR
jgi:hypothetical protein